MLFAALDTSSCNPAGDVSSFEAGPAALVVLAFVRMRFAGRLRARPGKPSMAGIATMHFSNIMESCLLAPLTRIISGMPLASTTRCRLEPSLTRSMGSEPVCCSFGGLAPRSHRCGPSSNQSGHVRAYTPASPDAISASRRWHSSHISVASRACHCRSPRTGEGLPMEYLFAARTGIPLRTASITALLRPLPKWY